MAAHEMSEDERRAFLLDPPKPAMLSTVRADGRPHVAPVWFDLDGDTVVFNTGESTVKGRNIRRDPRVALGVQDNAFSFVVMEGVAEVSDDLEEVRRWATRIGGRYMGEDRAEEYGARNGVPGELAVRVRVTGYVSMADVAE